MSGYQPGRRAPNVSQYIAGLNQIPLESDFIQDDSLYNFEEDLALFTNTEFIHNDIVDFDLDFDFTQSIPGEEEYLKQDTSKSSTTLRELQPNLKTDSQDIITAATTTTTTTTIVTPNKESQLHNSSSPLPPPPSPHGSQPNNTPVPAKKQKLSPRSTKSNPSSSSFKTSSAGDANSTPGLKDPLRISIPSSDNNSISLVGQHNSSTTQTGNGDMNYQEDFHFTDIGFTPQGNITNHNIPYVDSASGYDFGIPPQSPFDTKHQLHTPVTTPPNGQQGIRPQGILPDAAALLEASSRAAAEEDKRRRNTAASARFRYKKKQREQALEKSAKDMTDKLDKLEEKINQLEKENTWLRSLVIERTAKSSEEMAELYKTFKEEERSKDQYKKGVGTQSVEK